MNFPRQKQPPLPERIRYISQAQSHLFSAQERAEFWESLIAKARANPGVLSEIRSCLSSLACYEKNDGWIVIAANRLFPGDQTLLLKTMSELRLNIMLSANREFPFGTAQSDNIVLDALFELVTKISDPEVKLNLVAQLAGKESDGLPHSKHWDRVLFYKFVDRLKLQLKSLLFSLDPTTRAKAYLLWKNVGGRTAYAADFSGPVEGDDEPSEIRPLSTFLGKQADVQPLFVRQSISINVAAFDRMVDELLLHGNVEPSFKNLIAQDLLLRKALNHDELAMIARWNETPLESSTARTLRLAYVVHGGKPDSKMAKGVFEDLLYFQYYDFQKIGVLKNWLRAVDSISDQATDRFLVSELETLIKNRKRGSTNQHVIELVLEFSRKIQGPSLELSELLAEARQLI